nr:TetR/AcrR family transcriptional regulator [Nocardioides albus]
MLVQAAIQVMARDGVAQATTRSIVAEADMPLGTFHYCFRSKEELLEQVITTITGHTLAPALEIIEGPGTLEEKLRGGLASYWQHVLDNPDEHRVTYELTQYATRSPALAEVARLQYRTYLDAHTTVIETLAASAGVRWTVDVAVLARYLTAIVDGLTLLYLNEGDAETAGAAIDLAATQLLGLVEQPS